MTVAPKIPIAAYRDWLLVMMLGLGINPLLTSTQLGLAAPNSYPKQPVIT